MALKLNSVIRFLYYNDVMNFDQISCFLNLSKTLSFTQTSILMGLTQPSVSRQIRTLEESLGLQLFIRNKHFVQLTSQGREFRTEIEPLMKAFQNTIQRTLETSKSFRGPLSIGCLPEAGQNHFYRFFLEFQNQHPDVNLHVRYLLAHEILALLKAGELDFGITPQPQISENFRSYKISEEKAVLVTRSSNTQFSELKKNPEKITTFPFVGYSRVDSLLNAFLKAYHSPADASKLQVLSSVNSHASMIEALLSRDCFAVIPSFSVEGLVQSKKLKIVGEKDLRSTLYLVELEKIAPSAKEKAFRDFLITSSRRREPKN